MVLETILLPRCSVLARHAIPVYVDGMRWLTRFASGTCLQHGRTLLPRATCRPKPLCRSAPSRMLLPTELSFSHVSRARDSNASTHRAGNFGPTIFALSTAAGRAGIAIVRVSGPAAALVYQALCPQSAFPEARRACLRTLYDPLAAPEQQSVLDQDALVLWFPAPRSVTGENVLELHVHGGPATVKAVLAAIPDVRRVSGAQGAEIRYAEPGEFTQRAFFNGRLDLHQVEALGDVLSAETEQQRRLALTESAGGRRYEAWRQQLLEAQGELEALIDFSEDHSLHDELLPTLRQLTEQVQALRRRVLRTIEGSNRGELVRSGVSIALVGPPNAGKSSLLNQIIGREAAIVSPEAGTTRDVVEVCVDIGGFLCKFWDLAGLRDDPVSGATPIGLVEREGMRRAQSYALQADIILVILPADALDSGSKESDARSQSLLNLVEEARRKKTRIITVVNKIDLLSDAQRILAKHSYLEEAATPTQFVSCEMASKRLEGSITEDASGMPSLLDCLKEELTSLTRLESEADGGSWAEDAGANERQRALLVEAVDCLQGFIDLLEPLISSSNGGSSPCAGTSVAAQDEAAMLDDLDFAMCAEQLREAAACMARITGRGEAGNVEEVLGVVFEKFCVGK